jgi:hypothetical protein
MLGTTALGLGAAALTWVVAWAVVRARRARRRRPAEPTQRAA